MLNIRTATADDAALLMRFVRELAIYEKAEHEVLATEDDLRRDVFGPDSRVEALICEWDGEPIGHAIFFMNYSTWLGKYGINVNVVNPGPVLTEGAAFGEAQLEALKKTIPFRRGGDESEVLGTTQDIANAVLYFASDLGAYTTGTKMNVFGGQAMG